MWSTSSVAWTWGLSLELLTGSDASAPDSYEGSVDDDSTVKSYVTLVDGNQQDETVTWSRVRYTGYCLLVIDSEPATHKGQTSTLTLRGLSSTGAELDRLVLARTI